MVVQKQIMEWTEHPELLDKESLYELRKVVNAYPYYQLARILFLKNLYLLNMPEFKAELKKGVLYVADVSLLFYYLEGDKFAIAKHTDETEGSRFSESDRTLALIDSFLKDDDEPVADEIKLVPEAPADYTSLLLKEEDAQDSGVPLLKGHDLIDDFLKQAADEGQVLYRFEPEGAKPEETVSGEQQAEEDATVTEAVDETEEVDHPMADEPVQNQSESTENWDDDETEEPVQGELAEDTSLSETLAKIYVKQQKYDKALEIIKKLNLKYPKKNAYFADQIRFLEKLIINTKSK